MADFKLYLPKLLQYEGKYSNNPNDAGGETYKGISRVNHPKWLGWNIIDSLKHFSAFPNNLESNDTLQGLVSSFYKYEYWDKYQADNINNQSIAELLVDWEVNSGEPGVAIPQKLLGLVPDGIAGPKTIASINLTNQQDFFNAVVGAHDTFYKQLVVKHPNDQEFLKGWETRLYAHVFQA